MHGPSVLIDLLADLCDVEASSGALEQTDTKALLEKSDPATDARLGDAEHPRGRGKAVVPHDGGEELEVVEVVHRRFGSYHSSPLLRRVGQRPAADPGALGRQAIANNIATFIRPGAPGIESLALRLVNIVAEGPIVMTERVDVFKVPQKSFELQVMGIFEVRDGKIDAWRDYFDMNQFTTRSRTPEPRNR